MSLNNEKEHLTQVNDNNGSLNESVASSSVPELLDFSPLSSEEVYQLAREFIKCNDLKYLHIEIMTKSY